MRRAGLVYLIFIFACASAPPARLSQPLRSGLRQLLGEWNCAAKDGTRARWRFAPDLGGAFVEALYREPGYELKGHIGWDEDAERLIAGFADSEGAAETESAGDWNGDELTFNGTLRDGDRRLNFRRIFRSTPSGFDWRLEVQQDTDYAAVVEQSCTH